MLVTPDLAVQLRQTTRHRATCSLWKKNVPFWLLLCLKDHIHNSKTSLTKQPSCYLWSFYQTRPADIFPIYWKREGRRRAPCLIQPAATAMPSGIFPPAKLSLLNTNGSWGVETDTIHQKSMASHLKRDQRNSHGKNFTHILACGNYCLSSALGAHLFILLEITSAVSFTSHQFTD